MGRLSMRLSCFASPLKDRITLKEELKKKNIHIPNYINVCQHKSAMLEYGEVNSFQGHDRGVSDKSQCHREILYHPC